MQVKYIRKFKKFKLHGKIYSQNKKKLHRKLHREKKPNDYLVLSDKLHLLDFNDPGVLMLNIVPYVENMIDELPGELKSTNNVP